LMVHDALRQSWDVLTVKKNPDCPVCGERPSITELVDYEAFCAVKPSATPSAGASMPGGSVPAATSHAVPQISALELAGLRSDEGAAPGVLVVDVRGSQERSIADIPGAQAIHLDEFRSGAAVPRIPFDRTVVIVCRAGVRSDEAARIMIEAGHPDVRSLEGGVLAWVRDVDPAQPRY